MRNGASLLLWRGNRRVVEIIILLSGRELGACVDVEMPFRWMIGVFNRLHDAPGNPIVSVGSHPVVKHPVFAVGEEYVETIVIVGRCLWCRCMPLS